MHFWGIQIFIRMIHRTNGIVQVRQHAIAASEASVGNTFLVWGEGQFELVFAALGQAEYCWVKPTCKECLEFDRSAVWTEQGGSFTNVSNEVAQKRFDSIDRCII